MHDQRARIESLADVDAMPDPHRLVLFGYVQSRTALQSHLAMLLRPASLLVALYLLADGAMQHFEASFLVNLVLGLKMLIPFVLAGFLAFFGLHAFEAFGTVYRTRSALKELGYSTKELSPALRREILDRYRNRLESRAKRVF